METTGAAQIQPGGGILRMPSRGREASPRRLLVWGGNSGCCSEAIIKIKLKKNIYHLGLLIICHLCMEIFLSWTLPSDNCWGQPRNYHPRHPQPQQNGVLRSMRSFSTHQRNAGARKAGAKTLKFEFFTHNCFFSPFFLAKRYWCLGNPCDPLGGGEFVWKIRQGRRSRRQARLLLPPQTWPRPRSFPALGCRRRALQRRHGLVVDRLVDRGYFRFKSPPRPPGPAPHPRNHVPGAPAWSFWLPSWDNLPPTPIFLINIFFITLPPVVLGKC